MPKDLPRNATLLIVSDTGMYRNGNEVYAFGPVVKEVEAMLRIFDQITWIGFNRQDQRDNASYLKVPKDRVTSIFLPNVGGKSVSSKLTILTSYPKMWRAINEQLKMHQYIHSRAPSNPAYITMRLSKRYPQKEFWFKYAGSWVERASKFYEFQRKALKSLKGNSKVTVNGKWPNQAPNILAFENPCITIEEWEQGKDISSGKANTHNIDYCFVGGLNHNKGVSKIITAWRNLEHPQLGTLHIIGDGPLRDDLEASAKESRKTINFHGSLSKDAVHEVYKKCHFIILPSASEGFPKVIGEAMNYGCVPVVSNISCMDQYVANGKNGFLLTEISSKAIIAAIEQSLSLSKEEYKAFNALNHKLAKKFTYQYYLDRIENELFKLKK